MTDAPQPPTRAELEDNVTSVCYEVAAMERAADLAQKGGRFRFEAFCLHARLLREFLWEQPTTRGPGADNSLVAEHYFDDPATWRGTKGGLPATLWETKDRIDRQIAHLARDRIGDFMDLEVRMPDIRTEIMAQWARFESKLDSAWARLFAESLQEWRQELAKNQC
jgi:hypothetical protein